MLHHAAQLITSPVVFHNRAKKKKKPLHETDVRSQSGLQFYFGLG